MNSPYFIILEISPPGASVLHQKVVSVATEVSFVHSYICFPAAQTPKLRTPPLSTIYDCLFSVLYAYLQVLSDPCLPIAAGKKQGYNI